MKVLGKSSLASTLKVILDITWVLSLIGVGLAVVLIPILVMNSPSPSGEGSAMRMGLGHVSFEMDPEAVVLRSDSGMTAYISEAQGTLKINGFLGWQMAAAMATAALLGTLYLFCLFLVRKLFATFAEGAPFDHANTRRMRHLGLGLAAMELVRWGGSLLISYLMAAEFHGDQIAIVAKGDLSLTAIFGGAVMFVLAEIFRMGRDLQTDAELTV